MFEKNRFSIQNLFYTQFLTHLKKNRDLSFEACESEKLEGSEKPKFEKSKVGETVDGFD